MANFYIRKKQVKRFKIMKTKKNKTRNSVSNKTVT